VSIEGQDDLLLNRSAAFTCVLNGLQARMAIWGRSNGRCQAALYRLAGISHHLEHMFEWHEAASRGGFDLGNTALVRRTPLPPPSALAWF
jgi:hypothetical protein